MLILLGKAEMVLDDKRKPIKSVSRSFPCPSIIKLRTYINLPYKKVVLTRKNILRRDSYKCCYCGRGDLPLTIDHIVPKAKGGKDSWENLVCACVVCNNKKSDRTPEEAEMSFEQKPFKPSHIMFLKKMVGRLEESWKPFLYVT